MSILDDLIKEGKSFVIKTNLYRDGVLCKHDPKGIIENEKEVCNWIYKSKRYIAKCYSNEDIAFTDFENISNQKLSKCNIDRLVAIIESLKEIPEKCLPPVQKSSNQVINITQSQTQNQSQSINSIIESIKEEIGEDMFEELKKIQGENDDEKKKNIFDKLKTFGKSTLSNIIANILTNPSIWSQL